ncbi:hypothetical protein [Acanthopleuribacter pedis]|uniref:Uncharacterized protein n=1 Tax=Acanthopleuribacter pedis TaxID=442870 RepID=A0A8J7Q887_9BACT|nr:hypothetical protein [Acanthopleuribacter pedis]MBO1319224.1 hypothetical protein [Acanthopleuribacter pedis]
MGGIDFEPIFIAVFVLVILAAVYSPLWLPFVFLFQAFERLLAKWGLFSPFRSILKLARVFPGLTHTEDGLVGPFRGHQLHMDSRSLEVIFNPPLPYGFELKPFDKHEQRYFECAKTGDRAFDATFLLRLGDPNALAWFDADTRRRLVSLRHLSATEGRLCYLTPHNFWTWGRARLRARGWAWRQAQLPIQASCSSVIQWVVALLSETAVGWQDDPGMDGRLRAAIIGEHVSLVQERLAALWCDLADAGTPGDWSWPEPADSAPFALRFLHIRGLADADRPAHYRAVIGACPASLRTAFLRDVARFEAATQIEILHEGLGLRPGTETALAGLTALGNDAVRALLVELADEVLSEKGAAMRDFAFDLLVALRDLGPHPDTEALFLKAVRRYKMMDFCLDSLDMIGSPAVIAELVPLRSVFNLDAQEKLDRVILSLQLRHGLLVGGGGGGLSLVVPEQGVGDLTLSEDQQGALTRIHRDRKVDES